MSSAAERKLKQEWSTGRQSMNMDPAIATREHAPTKRATLADMEPDRARAVIAGAVFAGTIRAHCFLVLVVIVLAILFGLY